MSTPTDLFYSLSKKCKRFSWLGLIALLLSSCAGAGGINIDAPVADLEGGTTNEATVCDVISGAPSGAFVRIRNISDSQVSDVDQVLPADGSFSLLICVEVGETLEIQIFDDTGTAISPVQNLTRSGTDTGTCATPDNAPPNCP